MLDWSNMGPEEHKKSILVQGFSLKVMLDSVQHTSTRTHKNDFGARILMLDWSNMGPQEPKKSILVQGFSF